MNTNKIISTFILALFLAACGGQPAGPSSPVEEGPTVDPNLVFTSGAQTVVAQITIDAANRPVPTAALPATITPASLPTLQPLGSEVPPAAGAVVSQPEALPTLAGIATLTPAAFGGPTAVAPVPDRMTWVSNVPPDNSKVPAGKPFKITWTVTNIGTTTWTTEYYFKHFAGTQLGKLAAYPVTKEVKPNASVDLTIDAVAPITTGDVYSLWVLQNPDGVNFGRFDITLTVQ
jgi:hypothetical protein